MGKNILGILSLIPLSKERSKCPAIIFAANRTERVIGRIIFLIVSIKTIKKDRAMGVPKGTKWVNIWFIILIQPYNINKIQNGSAIDKATIK